MKREDKIKFIIEQEKAANNSWKWIKTADDKTINELYRQGSLPKELHERVTVKRK